jgi:hypothetical protein
MHYLLSSEDPGAQGTPRGYLFQISLLTYYRQTPDEFSKVTVLDLLQLSFHPGWFSLSLFPMCAV